MATVPPVLSVVSCDIPPVKVNAIQMPPSVPHHLASVFNACSERVSSDPLTNSDFERCPVGSFVDSAADEDLLPPCDPVEVGDVPAGDELLYKGAPLSVHESMVSILTFSQTESISCKSLGRLLALIRLHLPTPNVFFGSAHQFFQRLELEDSPVQIFYYCSTCFKDRASATSFCDICVKKSVDYYIYVPVGPQIARMFARKNFCKNLCYKNTRTKKNDANIEDIYDGQVYSQYEKEDGTFEISLTWNTDGVSPYTSSSFSLWPFYFVINELAPEERYKKENMIIGGLWGSHEKPNPNVYLRPLYNELDELKTSGMNVQVEGSDSETNCKVTVLCGSCDSPAKSTFFNIKSHAGYQSCPQCLIEGEKSDRTGDVLVFPHQDVLEMRTHENYLLSVQKAIETKEPSGGVKGASLLYFMVDNMFESTSIDSMHCLHIGVLKQMLNLWFNPTFCKAAFSLSKKVEDVNRLMSKLRLPHFVQRDFVPVDKLAFWKASLCRNFLSYILLPLLSKFMSKEYFNHTKLLVAAVGLLNSDSVSHCGGATAV